MRRIKKRRHVNKEPEINQGLIQEVYNSFVILPNDTLPRDAEVLNTSKKVNKKVYAIIEWWCLTTNTDSYNINLTQLKVFG